MSESKNQIIFNKSEVVITDVKMPFWSMVTFMVKWAIAAIPAVIILAVIGFFIAAIFGNLLTTK